MSATLTQLPSGKRRVRCDHCRESYVTPFRDVALKWSRDHKCRYLHVDGPEDAA